VDKLDELRAEVLRTKAIYRAAKARHAEAFSLGQGKLAARAALSVATRNCNNAITARDEYKRSLEGY